MKIFSRPGPRFAAEAAAIVLAAVIPGLEHLVWWQIGACVAVVLLAAIAIESAMSGAPAQAAPAAVPLSPPVVEQPHVRVLHEKPIGELLREVAPPPEPVAPPPPPPPEPEPEPEPEPVTVAVSAPAERVAGPPYNVWELERAHAASGVADDEKTFLLQYLRDYATADGALPPEFEDLVRESFPHLL